MTNPTPMKPQRNEDENKNSKFSFNMDKLPFQATTKDLIAYIILVLGIILLFFQPIYGGLLIGIVTGIYFAKELIAICKDLPGFIDEQGIARSLILGGLTLAFFIAAPAIFVGAAFVVLLRWFVFNED